MSSVLSMFISSALLTSTLIVHGQASAAPPPGIPGHTSYNAAAAIRDSAALIGSPTLISGRVAKLSTSGPQMVVGHTWPSDAVLRTGRPGDEVKTPPVARAAVAADGTYVLRLDPSVDLTVFTNTGGHINLNFATEDGTNTQVIPVATDTVATGPSTPGRRLRPRPETARLPALGRPTPVRLLSVQRPVCRMGYGPILGRMLPVFRFTIGAKPQTTRSTHWAAEELR